MARQRELTLADLLPRRAAEAPETVAFIVDGSASLSYAQWDRRSNAAARGLRGRGIGLGDRVVLWFDAGGWADLAVAYAGAHKAGAVPVPLGAWVGGALLSRVAAHCGAAAVVAGGLELPARAPFLTAPLVGFDDLEVGQGDAPLAGASAPGGPVEVAYRCGFLTRPEGHERAAAEILSGLTAKDLSRSAGSTIHTFAAGTAGATEALWFPLPLARGPVVVLPAFEPERFCALAAEHGVERWCLTPATALWLMESGALDGHDGSTVAQVVLEGGRPSPALLARLAARLPGASVISVVGPAGTRAAYAFDPDRPGSVGRRLVSGGDSHLPGGELGRVQLDDGAWALGYTLEEFLYLLHGEREVVRRGGGVTGAEADVVGVLRQDPAVVDAAVVVEPDPRREPGGDAEGAIASIFERVLDRTGVGVHDDFFDLGGDQLAATEVVSLVEDALDIRLEPWAVLDAPTVSALASEVDRLRREGAADAGPPTFVPLAASQEGMVWHEQFAPGSQNLPPLVRRYRGPLDAGLFERALGEIVRRHEPLRTTFQLREGRAVQVVSPPSPLSLPVRDLAGLPGDEQDGALAEVLADAGRPFDLIEGPLFEPTLLRLGPEDHVAVFRVHHSVYDDWSVGVFRAELSALYAALAAGESPPLEDLPVPFSTFARRQRRRLAGPAGAAQLRWWRGTLAGGPLGLELPVDDPDRPEGSAQPSAEPVSIDLPPELSAHLRALARRQRATPFMTVLAAFEVLLHRYTGQPDLLLASVVANRNRTELEGMVGCFTKKILLRQAVPGDATFADVLTRTRAVLLGALSNQDLAFETVVQDALGAPAALHGLVPSPVVMVQGVTPPAPDVVLPGIATSGYETSATTRRTHFRGGSDGDPPDALAWGAGLYRKTFLILSVSEHDDHLSLSARGAFHRPAVERLLANFTTLLTDAVAHPFRPVSELALVDPGERALLAVESGADADVIDRCLHHLFDDQVARSPSRVAIDAGSTRLTFAELATRTDEVARRLRAAGVGPGTFVGLGLSPSIDCVVGVLGIWKAGGAYVGLDPEDCDGRLPNVVAEASPAVVVAPPSARHPALAGARVVDVEAPDNASDGTPSATLEDARPSGPALAFYGAGASAVPPGVVLSHRSVAGLLAGLRRDVYPADPPVLRVALSARATEDAFLRQVVALLDGHTLRVAPPERLPAGDVDLVDGPPDPVEASGAAVVVVGTREPAGALPRPDGATVHHLFGPPECAFGAGLVTAGPGGRRLLTPLVGVVASVLDRAGQPAPIGVTGELHVSRPEEPGWSTGLLARHRPDGTVELAGKASDVIRLRGFDVDRAKLEAALRRHPDVRAVRVNHDAPGERLVAQVVRGSGGAPTLTDLQLHVWAELPGYAWPSAITVDEPAVVVPPIAGTTTAGSEGLPEAAFLAALWAEVLGVEEVPLDANYWQRFSFLQVVERARAAGVQLTDEQVTRNRTLATLGADMASQRLVEMAKTTL